MKTDLGGLVANASIEYGGPQKDLKYPRPVETCLMTYSVSCICILLFFQFRRQFLVRLK